MAVSRRALLGGGVVAAAGLAGFGVYRFRQPEPAPAVVITADQWIASRRAPYFIGHRGAGCVVPEHTIEGYEYAISRGLPAIEMSVGVSNDGVVYCMHDAELNRTTTLRGGLSAYSSAEIDEGRVRVPRLGPAWTGAGMPRIPRLDDALAAVASRAVLCIEAKAGAAFQPMMRLIQDHAAMGTVIIKAPVGSSTIEDAHKIGAPVFAYLGAGEDVNLSNLEMARRTLDRERDVLVVPTRFVGSFFDDTLIGKAVDQRTPVWVYSTHRRSEVKHYLDRGVVGFVTTMPGYASADTPSATADTWDSGRLAGGMLTRDPYSDGYALSWQDEGVIGLETAGPSAYLTMGTLCPIAESSYVISVQGCLSKAPRSGTTGIGVVVGTADDASPGADRTTLGYECIVGSDGTLIIRTIDDVDEKQSGRVLAEKRFGPPLRLGDWDDLVVRVDPTSVTLSWGGQEIRASDSRWRGGYFHIGRVGATGAVSYRQLSVAAA